MEIHVIRTNDTLWNIARQYGADIEQIILLNDLQDPNTLVVGQAIVIPDPLREYVVKPGDVLWQIAARYSVSVQDLSAYNQITNPSLIFPGQLLFMPYVLYPVQQGDNLWSIAQRYGVTIQEIAQMNQLTNVSFIYIGQLLRIPNRAKPSTEVNAYTTEINEAGRLEVLQLGRYFTYLSPFMYSMREDGTITDLQDEGLIEAAQLNEVLPLLVLTNFRNSEFDSDLAASVLRNPEVQETLITNLLAEMKTKGYSGLNIDFEYIYPEDRENYNNFLRRVVQRLHPEGFSVSTAVAPKERADQEGLLYEAHDYRAHGEIVDFVVLMTYEWGWAGGRPWAIAPINKVRDVLDYAVTEIPPEKILMGVPLYGRDWRIPWEEGTFARTVSPKEAVDLAARYGVAIQYDETYQSPFFQYTDENGQRHEVWFEDARSMQVKYDTVKQYGLRGISYWVLGNPFPQNWPVLQNNFFISKITNE